MNTDLYYKLLKYIDSPNDLKNYCLQNKFFYSLFKENKQTISKYFLERYHVDYTDPTNFIYVMNDKIIDDYRVKDLWDYISLFKLYIKLFNDTEIRCENKGITSFPIYPNMTILYGRSNQLTSFPIPKMTHFYGNNNQLTSFPIQPNTIDFRVEKNQLTSFPIQPKMKYFDGHNNRLTSFLVQPNNTFLAKTIN